MQRAFAGLFGLLLAVSAPAATTINFDDLTASAADGSVLRVVPAGYNSFVTFSTTTGAGLYVWAEASSWQNAPAATLANVVCPAFPSNAKSCLADLTIAFGAPVNAVSIWTGAWTTFGSQLVIEAYTGSGVLAGTTTVNSPQPFNTNVLIDISTLTGVNNITSLRLVNPLNMSDVFGVVLDTLTFTGPVLPPVPPTVTAPEPGSVLLSLGGLLALVAVRRRR